MPSRVSEHAPRALVTYMALLALCSPARLPARFTSSTTPSIHSTSSAQLHPPGRQHPSPDHLSVVSSDIRAYRSALVDRVARAQPWLSGHPGHHDVTYRHRRVMPVKRVQEKIEDEYTPQNLARLQMILQELGYFDRVADKTPVQPRGVRRAVRGGVPHGTSALLGGWMNTRGDAHKKPHHHTVDT